MAATNYDDVMHQLQAHGLLIPPREGLRIGSTTPVRVHVQDGGREKRGWYVLKEWSPDAGRLLIVGSYGIYRGNDSGKQKIALPKDDANRITPEQRAAMKRAWAEQAAAAETQRKRLQARAAERARKVWQRLATQGDSPYLAAKGVSADPGLRFTENGTAVIPLIDTGGMIHGLQFLRTAAQAEKASRPGKPVEPKEFWPAGLAKKGHFHIIGAVEGAWLILVAEGYATARTLNMATGHPVAVAFDAGNLQPVAEALRKRHKLAKILVCADDDSLGKCRECRARVALALHPDQCPACGKPHGYSNAGVTAASTAAMSVGGEWVAPQFPNDAERIADFLERGRKLTDFNDLHIATTLTRVGEQVAARLLALRWSAPAPRASSSTTGGAGKTLRPLHYLDDLLGRFATIYGGKEGVFDAADHCLVTEKDVQNLCVRHDIYKAWKEHAERRIVRLDDIGFDPACTDPNVTCNLWAGWPTTPEKGDCSRLLELLRYMCSGERNGAELYDWVLRWVAYPIQHPGAKMKTTIVVHGPQGAGKNVFFETVMDIYGKYGRILDQDALTDKHNDWASRKLFLIADEVVAQAHRFEVKNKLKTLITGNWVRINPKHIAAYDEANHVNLVFLSNETMPVVLEEDDRRHCIIWTPPKKSPDFYRALLQEIQAGGVAALHDYLLHVDLGDFHPGTAPPDTAAKRELVDLAQDSPVDFVDALFAKDLSPLLPMPGLTTDWYAVYQRWCGKGGVKPASLKRFVNTVERRRGFATGRKGYLSGQSITNPLSMLTFGYQPPEGVIESTWLGDQVAAMKNGMNDYLSGGGHAHRGDYT